jgi:hypothetical protein
MWDEHRAVGQSQVDEAAHGDRDDARDDRRDARAIDQRHHHDEVATE